MNWSSRGKESISEILGFNLRLRYPKKRDNIQRPVQQMNSPRCALLFFSLFLKKKKKKHHSNCKNRVFHSFSTSHENQGPSLIKPKLHSQLQEETANLLNSWLF